ncbi:MAG: patatin-like phospholipase family protein [Fimbriimonadaceae bacterium]|nr:patatin-like phospholipase family protein [Fimbriimonadaceae bacterium]
MNAQTALPVDSRFQILSLDGGGIKGLFSAAVLAAIEEDLKLSITDHFDLLAGTSTGGIIALGLGLGMKPREIVEFYLREGPKIFPSWWGMKGLQHWVYRKFSEKPLVDALQSCFKDRRFGDSQKRLVIPSYNLGEDDVYNFRTPHHARLTRDYKVPAWKVALATSSAPTFFPCTREVGNVRLIDGGVWANNPTMVAVAEAYETLGVPLANQWVFSIGTSDAVVKRAPRLNSGGIIAWGLGNAAVDVIMRGQSIGANNQATLLLGRDHVERLNPKVADGEFSLDGVSKADDLIGKASHVSRIFTPTFQLKFAGHRAKSFEPLHK